jgi:septum formation protein
MNIILASNSSARRSMLENAGCRYQAKPSAVDEELIKKKAELTGLALPDLALKLAIAKASDIAATHPDAMVIGSDQVLECEGARLSKVDSMQAAHDQLRRLQGKTHQLYSAVAVCKNSEVIFQHVETADLTMWPMSDDEIHGYLDDAGATVLGSVGCYQIEGKGIRLFSHVSGDHFTIMGMPLIPLLGYLRSCASETGD